MKIKEDLPYFVREGNRIIFTTTDGEEMVYEVKNTFLQPVEWGFMPDTIFKLIGIDDVTEFAFMSYGYEPTTKPPWWPEFKEGDMVAASRIVTELSKYCNVHVI